jgi:hypothetical protein
MALEDDIRRLTEAVQELTAQMRQQTGNPVPVFTDNLEPLPKAKPAKAKAEEAAAKLDYVQHIQTPALTLVKAKGRDALAGILAEFNAKTAKDIGEDQWPALAARIAEASA